MNKTSLYAIFITSALFFVNSASAQTLTKHFEKRQASKNSRPGASEGSPSPETSSGFVLSQVYGGGGGSTGTYLHDYVELKNVSSSPKSLQGLALYYGSATGQFASSAGNQFALPNVTVPAGGYFLVQTSGAGSAGAPLPVTPDATTTNLSMSGTSGKIALVAGLPANTCGATATPCPLPNFFIVDLVAWGIANNAEGGASTNGGVAITSTQGNVRKNSGCQDTDNNNADFDIVTAPVPRNSATTPSLCGIAANTRTPIDFDGDGRTDFVTLRDSNGAMVPGGFVDWYISMNSNGAIFQYQWGLVESDDISIADYDGDGKADLGVWRRSALSEFYYVQSSNNTIVVDQLGLLNDEPVSADYNGDGKADTAVFRNNGNGTSSWFYRPTPSSMYVTIQHSGQGSRAMGDYDGDGKNDAATFGVAGGGAGAFTITFSSGGVTTIPFGNDDDIVVPGDYDGDGKTDIAVVRPNGSLWEWMYEPSNTPALDPVTDTWGLVASDLPAPGDYNGDRKWDYGVWREAAQGEFFVMTPITRLIYQRQWGLGGDFPAATILASNGI